MTRTLHTFLRSVHLPQITLYDPRNQVAAAWGAHQGQHFSRVHIYHGEFGDLAQECDALIVPTNNAGVMLKEYVDYFGDPTLEHRLACAIRRRFDGKLLLGQAVCIATENRLFPYVFCTPIHRSDGVRGNEPTNAYVATRAILDLWRFGRYKRRLLRRFVKTMAIPLLAPDASHLILDVVAKEQWRAVQEMCEAYSQAYRQPFLVRL